MNILDIIVVFIVLYYTIRGMTKGLVSTLFGIGSFFIAALLTSKMYNAFSNVVIKTKINEWVQKGVYEKIYANSIVALQDTGTVTDVAADKMMDSLAIPKIIKPFIFTGQKVTTVAAIKIDGFMQQISTNITEMIIKILSIVILFFIVWFLLKIAVGMLEKIMKLPVLNNFNKLMGGALGFLRGMLTVYIICMVLVLFSPIKTFIPIVNLIDNSSIVKGFYNNNILIKWIL